MTERRTANSGGELLISFRPLGSTLLFLLVIGGNVSAQGLQLFGIGPVNKSMGGAGTAAPIEAIGALHTNTATLSALDNQVSIGAEILQPNAEIDSSFLGFSGSTQSDAGWMAAPSIGLAFRTHEESPFTWGLGMYALAGYALNYPASTTNPILFPQTPSQAIPLPGYGRVFAEVSVLQIVPAVSVQFTDQLSLGIGPTLTAGRALLSPFAFTQPDDANGDGSYTYPTGAGSKYSWGLGVQAGLYWKDESGLGLGASIRSPQWLSEFQYTGNDEAGFPRAFSIPFNYPMIISLGAGFSGIENLLLACDVRYFDWAHTPTLGDPAGVAPTGQLTGLGWRSTWSVSVGGQYKWTDWLTSRLGYTFTTNPIGDDVVGFNLASSTIQQHGFNAGLTVPITKALQLHGTYYYTPYASSTGPWQSLLGPVPGSSMTYRVGAQSVTFGLTATF